VIERETAGALDEQLHQVEERLGRLLASGWRQARGEAAELRADADALAEAGLVEVASRLVAVAEAQDAATALRTIALAVNACRLFRMRLGADEVPAGWLPLAAPKRKSRAEPDRLLPVARLRLADHDVWACAWANRSQWLLLEPPFPDEAAEAVAPVETTAGLFGRPRHQIGQALGGTPEPSFWLRRRVTGSLRWLARYPLGADGEVAYCALDDAAWEGETDAPDQVTEGFRQALSIDKVVEGYPLTSAGGNLCARKLQRDDPASYAWLDDTAAAVLAQAPDKQAWAIVWVAGGLIAPVARIVPGQSGRPARLIHLVPGAPEAILSSPG